MTTMFAPSEAAVKRQRRDRAFNQWRDLSGVDADTLKSMLAIVEKGQQDLAEIDAQIAELRGQIDAAAAEHAEITAPLQAELSSDSTTAQRRITARSGVMGANATLEATITPLKKLLDAAEIERQIAQGHASGRQVIENAYGRLGSEAEQERLKVLQGVEQAMVTVVEAIRRKAATADDSLREARAQLNKLPPGQRDSYANCMAIKAAEQKCLNSSSTSPQPEAQANLASAAAFDPRRPTPNFLV